MIPWKPGGAQGTPLYVLEHGDKILAACRSVHGDYRFPVIDIDYYFGNLSLVDDIGGGTQPWKNVVWYCTIKDLVGSFPEKSALTATKSEVESDP